MFVCVFVVKVMFGISIIIIIIIIIMFVSKVSTLWAIDIKWKKGELVSKISRVLVSLEAIHYYISSGLWSLKRKYCYDIVNAFGCNSLSLTVVFTPEPH